MNQKALELRGLRSTRESSSEQKNDKAELIGERPWLGIEEGRVARASPRLPANISTKSNEEATE
jgi:hypothetical protein